LEPAPWSKAIQRALILLALLDVEMLMFVLDYMYTLTLVSAIGLFEHPCNHQTAAERGS
jgi:hypothetical protein